MCEKLKDFHLDISSSLLLLQGPTKMTLSLYQIDFRCVSKRLYMCIEMTSICIGMTCIETTGHRASKPYQLTLHVAAIKRQLLYRLPKLTC